MIFDFLIKMLTDNSWVWGGILRVVWLGCREGLIEFLLLGEEGAVMVKDKVNKLCEILVKWLLVISLIGRRVVG